MFFVCFFLTGNATTMCLCPIFARYIFCFYNKDTKMKATSISPPSLNRYDFIYVFSGYSIINGSLYRIHPTWQLQYTFSLFSRFMTHGLTFSLFFALPLFFSLSLFLSLSHTRWVFFFFRLVWKNIEAWPKSFGRTRYKIQGTMRMYFFLVPFPFFFAIEYLNR